MERKLAKDGHVLQPSVAHERCDGRDGAATRCDTFYSLVFLRALSRARVVETTSSARERCATDESDAISKRPDDPEGISRGGRGDLARERRRGNARIDGFHSRARERAGRRTRGRARGRPRGGGQHGERCAHVDRRDRVRATTSTSEE
mgnify:CR=1 FL=1